MCADIVTNVSRSAACAIVDRGEAFKSPTGLSTKDLLPTIQSSAFLIAPVTPWAYSGTRDQHSIRTDYPLAERCNRSGIRYLEIGVE